MMNGTTCNAAVIIVGWWLLLSFWDDDDEGDAPPYHYPIYMLTVALNEMHEILEFFNITKCT